jgi:hypothetical protein
MCPSPRITLRKVLDNTKIPTVITVLMTKMAVGVAAPHIRYVDLRQAIGHPFPRFMARLPVGMEGIQV